MNISKVQELHFEIIKLSSFNDFDGERVVSDLLKNRNLWKGCILHTSDLLPLRGIPENIWNANSLFIQASGVNDNELFDIAQGWNPCEAYWLTPSETNTQLRTGGNVNPVLCLNWD